MEKNGSSHHQADFAFMGVFTTNEFTSQVTHYGHPRHPRQRFFHSPELLGGPYLGDAIYR